MAPKLKAWIGTLVVASAVGCATAMASPRKADAPRARAADAVAQRCDTSGLVVWLNTGGGGGAAGSSYFNLEFTNLSGHTCTLDGYPGVSAVNLVGRRLGSPAARDRSQTPHLLTLAPRATAIVLLRIVNAANFPVARCHQVTAAGLRVYPPGQTVSKVVPFPFRACSQQGTIYLNVRPATKG